MSAIIVGGNLVGHARPMTERKPGLPTILSSMSFL